MLEALYAGALEDAEKRLQKISLVQIELDALAAAAPLDAMAFLSPGQQVKIIAEVKRASPSRGDLSKIQAPEILAKTYEDNGAAAISVLTEQRKFKGSLEDLISVRQQVKIPVLRKDFISSEQQILEARAAGADLVLLIVAGLEEPRLHRLNSFTLDLGMTPFIETHTAEEVKVAVGIGSRLIGVNARDLKTFETDRNLFGRLVDLFPKDVTKVAESAVRDAADVEAYRAAGADVVLVGEALVTNDPALMLQSFIC